MFSFLGLLSCIELCIFLCRLILFISTLAKWLAGKTYSRDDIFIVLKGFPIQRPDWRVIYCMYSQHVTLSTFSLISLFLTARYLSEAWYSLFVLKLPLNPNQSIIFLCVTSPFRSGFRRRATCGRSEWPCGRWWRRRHAGRTTGSQTRSSSPPCVSGTATRFPETLRVLSPPPALPTVRESSTTWCDSVGAATSLSGRRSPTSAFFWPSRAPASARRWILDTAGHTDWTIHSSYFIHNFGMVKKLLANRHAM